MGRGIAVVFAYAGHRVALVDFKPRDAAAFEKLSGEALGEVRNVLGTLASFGLFDAARVDGIAARVSVVPEQDAGAGHARVGRHHLRRRAGGARPEARSAGAGASRLAGPKPIIASITSTILVDDLSGAVKHPARFLNAHWLNPAFLVPLVEVSPGKHTDPAVTERVKALLEGVGKVPVVCAARPGYIVPRIQALAMNEAARIVEEGVASRGRPRQGDQIRLRHPLRGARHAGIYRLGRWRHSLLCKPLSHGRARQRALRLAKNRREQHGPRAASG